jgi:phage/plasmid-like protein (TIGR03299 family)
MPAGIEYDSATGRATFVAVREHGWHQMGTLVDHDITVAEGLELALMNDLDYRIDPFVAVSGSEDAPEIVPSASLRAATRRNPFDRSKREVYAAGMTDSFTMHTPEVAFSLGENVIDAGKPLSAMGLMDDGKRGFAAFRADALSIGGVDQVNAYLNIITAFDGSLATTARLSTIRVVCQNTASAVLGQHGIPTYKVRHVGEGLEGRIEDARAALGVVYAGMEEFQREAEALLAVDVTDLRFERIVEHLLPMPADEDKATQIVKDRIAQQRDQVRAIWNGPTVANVQNTAWGALNAYTEWLDWTAGGFKTDTARMAQQITPGSRMDQSRIVGAKKIAALVGLTSV